MDIEGGIERIKRMMERDEERGMNCKGRVKYRKITLEEIASNKHR
jgi:hypothetical protein